MSGRICLPFFVKRIVRSFDVRFRFFESLLYSSRVLELGCGRYPASITIKALYPEIEIHGVDIVPKNEVPDFVLYKIVDLDHGTLPYPDDHFNAVIFTHVIEHLRAPLRLGKEINRVMKTGAKIYVETPNWTTMFVPSFGFHREQHRPFNFFDDPSHLKPWTKHGLFEFLFQSCSLRVLTIGTVRNWLRIPPDFIKVFVGLIKGNREYIIVAFCNLYGSCIYGVGEKARSTARAT